MEETRTTTATPPANGGKAKEEANTDTLRIGFDFERYAHFLEDADLNEEQKRELLATLWNIMSEFVMLGFGVHPIQQACGKQDLDGQSDPLASSFLLQSDLKHMIEEFDDVADGAAPEAREGVEA